jgi:hypothetical protein
MFGSHRAAFWKHSDEIQTSLSFSLEGEGVPESYHKSFGFHFSRHLSFNLQAN